MLEFSTKVKFVYKGKEHVGRICIVNDDDTYDVVTTGEDGDLWKVPGKMLTEVPVPITRWNKKYFEDEID